MSGLRLLEWDSAFFGIPIARVDDLERLPEAVADADRRGVRCSYALVPAADLPTLQAAADLGFVARDLRLTFARATDPPAPDAPGVTPIGPSERATVTRLATTAFEVTRFRADPGFPRGRVDAMYAEWLATCLATSDRRAVLTLDGGRGFVACSTSPEGGSIDLVAVDPELGGRGRGRRLVEAAVAWCRARDAARVSVVTQGANVAAQRLYQRCGFATGRADVWLHRWVPADD